MSVKLAINKAGGGKSGALKLSDVFSADYNESLIHQVVVAYQAGARAGTRAQKNRAAVAGGGAKPWRQKGTGHARAGTISSPIFRGGGRAFPARTCDFSQKVNRKMYRAAMRSILSELNRQDRLVIIDKIAMDKPATGAFLKRLNAIDANKALVILAQDDANIALSARNLKSVSVCSSREINPVSLLSHEKVVVTVEAVKKIDEALQ